MIKIGKNRAIFVAKKMRDELIYNMAKSEGNTLSFAETSSVINGISVGGKKMEELHQIERLRDGWDEVIYQCENNFFEVSKENFIHLNRIVADSENPELGNFRTKPVFIGGTKWQPPLPMLLSEEFSNMLERFKKESNIEKKAYLLFLDSARCQFFADGNKRTAQLIMNGFLIENGYSLFSINESLDLEYKEKLVRFYENGDYEEMFDFMGKCQAQTDLLLSELDSSVGRMREVR
jgi:Fic family protein